MKRTEKFAALALVCVMALTSFTACSTTGGNGTGNSSAGGTSTSVSGSGSGSGSGGGSSSDSGSDSGTSDTDTNSGDESTSEEAVEKLIPFSSSRLYNSMKSGGYSSDNILIKLKSNDGNGVICKKGDKLYVEEHTSNYSSTYLYIGSDTYIIEDKGRGSDTSHDVDKSEGIAVKESGSYSDIYDIFIQLYAPKEVLNIKSSEVTLNGQKYYAEIARIKVDTDYSLYYEAIYVFEGSTNKIKYVLTATEDMFGGSYNSITLSQADTSYFKIPSSVMTWGEYLHKKDPTHYPNTDGEYVETEQQF